MADKKKLRPMKMFGFRVPLNRVATLDAAIASSGLSQSEFFRIALESQMNAGGLNLASFVRGREQGHRDAAHLMQKFSSHLSATALRMIGEAPEPDYDAPFIMDETETNDGG